MSEIVQKLNDQTLREIEVVYSHIDKHKEILDHFQDQQSDINDWRRNITADMLLTRNEVGHLSQGFNDVTLKVKPMLNCRLSGPKNSRLTFNSSKDWLGN